MRSGLRRTPIVIAILVAVGAIVAGMFSDGRALVGRDEGTAPASSQQATSPTHRPPAVAGMFYPAEPDKLRAEIAERLGEAPGVPAAEQLVALIVPHAGYSYSAGVAAYAYRQVGARHFDTVVVIGPSHHVAFRGAALSTADYWDTPLGSVPVDRAACEALMKADAGARALDVAHDPEHSIEVQLPFLQTVLKDFRLAPVLMSDFSQANCTALARGLADLARGRSVLLVASSDMSHYPSYDDARRVDKETLAAIESLNAATVSATTGTLLSAGTPNLATCLCGEGPVEAVLMASRLLGADRAWVLRYANSGDIPGSPRDRVVGYGAIAIYRSASAGGSQAEAQPSELAPDQQDRLLSLARATIREYVTTGKLAEMRETDPAFLRPAAAFVTLKERGLLRGCIGSLEPGAPLYQAVRDNAVAAATRDRRFPPVTVGELGDLEIEISVLSPLRKVKSADEIELRKHGVVVAEDARRGVFLPQVADETGWSRDEFLDHLCSDKAGLPADAWRHGASLYVFTVQAFHSPPPGE
jgi:hypothetical protein